MRFSVIIPNYNYGDYVGAAIESALALDWPDVEVIVVDDGSTDHSAEVIQGFGSRIQAIFQPNATQLVACNVGFARATGDVIIFLDSDDLLDPAVAASCAAVFRPGVAKVQFQMMRIDANGKKLNSVFPAYKPMPTPEKILAWVLRTTAYPTPPGSGNVYARWFLTRLFPLDDACGAAPDSACVAAAPFLGDVVTIAKPLVFYRVHGRNDSNVLSDDMRFAREILRAEARFKFSRRFSQGRYVRRDSDLFNSLEVLQFRIASLKLTPHAHPLAEDTWLRAFRDVFRVAFDSNHVAPKRRVLTFIWSMTTLLVPAIIARKLIAVRYNRI
jgi:glycosyltransferase involved in cell wall biosynthesis